MVHRSVLLAVSVPAILIAGPAAAQQAADPDGARELLLERQEVFLAAMADKDADAVAALFTKDAVVHVANMPPIVGRSAIQRFYANLFSFLSGSRATPDAVHVSADADMAYGFGATSNEFRGRDGPVEYAGKYLLVWRKVADEWLIAAYSISSDSDSGVGR